MIMSELELDNKLLIIKIFKSNDVNVFINYFKELLTQIF